MYNLFIGQMKRYIVSNKNVFCYNIFITPKSKDVFVNFLRYNSYTHKCASML